MRFVSIPASIYRELFQAEGVVQRFTFDVLSGRVFELMALLSEAVSYGVEQRLAAFLLRRADENGAVHMSQEIIANHLGTAREVISRAVRAMVSEGLVRTRRGAVQITNRAALEALLEG